MNCRHCLFSENWHAQESKNLLYRFQLGDCLIEKIIAGIATIMDISGDVFGCPNGVDYRDKKVEEGKHGSA